MYYTPVGGVRAVTWVDAGASVVHDFAEWGFSRVVVEGLFPGSKMSKRDAMVLATTAGLWLGVAPDRTVRPLWREWFPALFRVSGATTSRAAEALTMRALTGDVKGYRGRATVPDLSWMGNQLGELIDNEHVRDAACMAAWALEFKPEPAKDIFATVPARRKVRKNRARKARRPRGK